MKIQYPVLAPLINKDDEYYKKYCAKIVNEILILNNCPGIKEIIIAVYDLIDEYDRITKNIIYQKPRIDNFIFLKNIKEEIAKTKKITNISFRLFRAIKENETKESLLDWFKNIEKNIFTSCVIVGNFKNKVLTTDIALEYLCKNNTNIDYGCVTIFHRKNELERCLNRVKIGCKFFVSQIIVDTNYNKTTQHILDNINVPVYITITPVFSENILCLLKSLGVNYNNNFTCPKNDNEIYKHLQDLIELFSKTKDCIISIDILSHSKKRRIQQLVKFTEIINNH